jgi:hypothetical protein
MLPHSDCTTAAVAIEFASTSPVGPVMKRYVISIILGAAVLIIPQPSTSRAMMTHLEPIPGAWTSGVIGQELYGAGGPFMFAANI